MSPVVCSGLPGAEIAGTTHHPVLRRRSCRHHSQHKDPAAGFCLQLLWVAQIHDQTGFSLDIEGNCPTTPVKRNSGLGGRGMAESLPGTQSRDAHPFWQLRELHVSLEGLVGCVPPASLCVHNTCTTLLRRLAGFARATLSRVVYIPRGFQSPDLGEGEP